MISVKGGILTPGPMESEPGLLQAHGVKYFKMPRDPAAQLNPFPKIRMVSLLRLL